MRVAVCVLDDSVGNAVGEDYKNRTSAGMAGGAHAHAWKGGGECEPKHTLLYQEMDDITKIKYRGRGEWEWRGEGWSKKKYKN